MTLRYTPSSEAPGESPDDAELCALPGSPRGQSADKGLPVMVGSVLAEQEPPHTLSSEAPGGSPDDAELCALPGSPRGQSANKGLPVMVGSVLAEQESTQFFTPVAGRRGGGCAGDGQWGVGRVAAFIQAATRRFLRARRVKVERRHAVVAIQSAARRFVDALLCERAAVARGRWRLAVALLVTRCYGARGGATTSRVAVGRAGIAPAPLQFAPELWASDVVATLDCPGLTFASLMCGVGREVGYSLDDDGPMWAGVAVDSCPRVIALHSHNHPDTPSHLYTMTSASPLPDGFVETWRGRVHHASVGMPCQPFSQAGARRGSGDERDAVTAALNALVALRPLVVEIENVLDIVKFPDTFPRIVRVLRASGYHVGAYPLTASDFGVPQKRRRLFVLASLLALSVLHLPRARHHLR